MFQVPPIRLFTKPDTLLKSPIENPIESAEVTPDGEVRTFSSRLQQPESQLTSKCRNLLRHMSGDAVAGSSRFPVLFVQVFEYGSYRFRKG